MRERQTVRVLLFDPDGRILMIKGRLPSDPDAEAFWFTVGGGIEPGETLAAAAVREVREESGMTVTDLGPVVWRRSAVMPGLDGQPMLFRERYVVARCAGGEPSRDGWDEDERTYCVDLRWWTLAEIAAFDAPMFPERFVELLPEVALGRYPSEPVDITT